MENALVLHQQSVSTLAVPESLVQRNYARTQVTETYALSPQQEAMQPFSEPSDVELLQTRMLEMESEAVHWRDNMEREMQGLIALASQRNMSEIEETQRIGQQAYDHEAYVAKEAVLRANAHAHEAIGAEQSSGHLRKMLEVEKSQYQQDAERLREAGNAIMISETKRFSELEAEM